MHINTGISFIYISRLRHFWPTIANGFLAKQSRRGIEVEFNMSKQLILDMLLVILVTIEIPKSFAQIQSNQVHALESHNFLDEDSRIGLSYLGHILANGQAQETGDCLVRVQESFDSVMLNPNVPKMDGAVIKREKWIRFRFDYRQNRYLSCIWTIEDRLELGLIDPKTGKPTRSINSSDFFSSCFDEIGQRVDVYSKILNGSRDSYLSRPLSKNEESPEKVLKQLNPFDFRVVGLNFTYDETTLNSYAEDISKSESSGALIDVSNSTDSIKMRHYYKGDKSGVSGFCDYVLDGKSLMTTKLQSFMRDPESGKIDLTSNEGSIEWIELSDVFLPARILVTGVREDRVRGTDRDFGASQIISDFHWFSINQPFDETAFDGSEIRDEEAIRKLLDPQLSQATSILEKIKKETVTVEPVTPTKPDQ